jgi:hypothetical protein
MSQKCCDDYKIHYKLVMGGAPQGAMRVASQIWQVVFASQTLQVFCLAFRKKAQYVVVGGMSNLEQIGKLSYFSSVFFSPLQIYVIASF